jgi:hypothetical protein
LRVVAQPSAALLLLYFLLLLLHILPLQRPPQALGA